MHYSLCGQIYLVAATLLSFPFLFGLLQIPKYIIDIIPAKNLQKNYLISGKYHPHSALRSLPSFHLNQWLVQASYQRE
jgi:hypothetical protein